MAYWYNIQTKQVETDENRSRNDDVMGPYATEDEARNALSSAAENTEQWDAEDKAWEGKGATWDDEDLED
ncbi:methionine aminopeptidase [Knoellia sinensis KCTC 19936]|uniref:Methionine aminopeptidase n=1 Tax=Knoellia sinensis KCTC 19936 TaxID=1385520 RepID=A0A0A0JBN7_9MICO|nr:hypothetical protein [Knoellia sinensis]KGN34558.1 methionine aminopeptidase [Knoellia sinensis KCTC 19936]